MTLSEQSGPLSAAVAPSLLREMNQRLLLDRLFTDGPAIRPQLARATGLSLPTVIAAVAGLERAGLVRAAGRLELPHGRPAETYEADPTSGTVVGVDIGHDWLRLLITDLAGNRLTRLDVRNSASSGRSVVELIRAAVSEAAAQAEIEPSAITHTVIGSPGVYDPRRRRIQYAANLRGWQRAGLTEALTESLGVGLTIDNDANLAALAEHSYGTARHVDNFVYVMIGTGVGLGLVLDGRLYRGARGAAGEAGYLPFGPPIQAARPGQIPRGMLEENLAADAVVRYAREAGMSAPLSAEGVFAAAGQGLPAALAAVRQEADRLAQLTATVLALFDPELIVFGGGIGQNLEVLEAETLAALKRYTPMTPKFALGELGREAVVLGAIARGTKIAREQVFKERIERV
jgi:predicted NBD/HSP70 family sugar kinase